MVEPAGAGDIPIRPIRESMIRSFVTSRPYLSIAGLCLSLAVVYFAYFVRRFLWSDIVLGGDTQMLWSFHYLAVYSFARLSEFLWWDPTAFNGWPAYFYWISGFVNYLSPFALPSLLGAWLAERTIGLSINTFLVLQKTLYYFLLNLLAVALISREIVQHRLARALPPLLFTLSEITFHGFRDAVLYEGLPGPLFYLFALIYHNNRRTRSSLLVFIFFSGIFLASLNYAFLQSSLYWTTIFTVALLLLYPDLLPDSLRLLKALRRTREGLATVAIGAVFLVSAFWAFYAPVHFNLGRFYRVPGTVPIDYDLPLRGGWSPPYYAIMSYEIWNNLLMWAPFSELHDFSLTFDPWAAGIDHRYLGLATLPLLLTALIRGYRNRYVIACFVTFFVCAAFIIYTVRNLAFLVFVDASEVFQNIRTMANTMPREGPSLLILFLAGIGLDLLIQPPPERAGVAVASGRAIDRFLIAALAGLLVLAALCTILVAAPSLAPVRHSLGHIGIYLGLFAGLCLMFLFIEDARYKRPLVYVFMALAFMDLSISASAYWERGKVWFPNQGAHTLPTASRIDPLTDESEKWAGPYRGAIHNAAGGPWYGLKEWLMLATRPEWQPVLENWNPATLTMKAYPDFRFYTGGRYIPFGMIRTIDEVRPPITRSSARIVERDGRVVLDIDDQELPIEHGLGGFVEHVILDADRTVTFRGWAIDEHAVRPAKGIVVMTGGRIWMSAAPSEERPDIAALNPGYRYSGFTVRGHPLEGATKRVRVFAILNNGVARELRYSDGYPFDPAAAPAQPNGRGAPQRFVYVHDEAARRGLDEPGKEMKEVAWRVLEFSPNRVRVDATVPEAGLLVYLDNYDRFWTARIDGEAAPIFRANFTFKAIRIPAGTHVVDWIYNPWPIKISWIWFYSICTTFAALALVWRARWGRPAGGPKSDRPSGGLPTEDERLMSAVPEIGAVRSLIARPRWPWPRH